MKKAEATKYLWQAVEVLTKTLKELQGNPLRTCMDHALWDSLRSHQDRLREIEQFEIGSYYYEGDDPFGDAEKKKYFIARVEDFVAGSSSIEFSCRVLTSTEPTILYGTKIVDPMTISMSHFSPHRSYTLKVEDLPLFLANAYQGPLFHELLKK